VDTLLQDYGNTNDAELLNPMNANLNRFKKMAYSYDLISGKVNQVAYQPGRPDQFYHQYTYDAENRLVYVETSSDSLTWEKDARYEYYRHGPLARVVLSHQQVQGIDYAYTLQGWLKGVNSTSLNPGFDMGGDGKISEIEKNAVTTGAVKSIKYSYDATGNRISKRVERHGTDSAEYTMYVRDAQGNVMAVYNSRGQAADFGQYSLLLNEQHMYGSSRLGILKRNADVKNLTESPAANKWVRGNKLFELSNHLGNVLATISDKKRAVSTGQDRVDYYTADLVSAQDYYPFGMQMSDRKGYSASSGLAADEAGISNLMEDFVVQNRSDNNHPLEYTALRSIVFEEGFESSEGDFFEAYITGGGEPSNGPQGGWVNGSSSTGSANDNYRYGFNGKENDSETQTQDYGMRIYDTRLGRFLSIDPITKNYPELTPISVCKQQAN
jgi:RHS repeat-associated protein